MRDAYVLVTQDCDNDCIFCSILKKELYLSFDELKIKIDKYVSQNYDQITFTGGEPTLSPYLFKLIKYVNSKKLTSRLITNGLNLSKNFLTNLIKCGLNSIIISIHSLDFEKAKLISSNIDYNLNKVLDMINFIQCKTNLDFCWNFTITGLNYTEIPIVAKYVVENCNKINVFGFNFIDFNGNAELNFKSVDIPVETRYYLIEKYLYEGMKIFKNNNINFRIERVPLCYLIGYEKYSSDYNRLISCEKYVTDFVDRDAQKFDGNDYLKSPDCKFCDYSKYCYGVFPKYVEHFGFSEIYPIFHKFKK